MSAPSAIVYAEPAVTPDGVETIARCATCAKPYVPRHAKHLTCSSKCRASKHDETPRRRAVKARAQAKQHALNVSYRVARRSLLRAGIDPATRPEIESLRGRGRVDGWREFVGMPSRRTGPRASRVVEAQPQPVEAFDPWALASPSTDHAGHALAVGFAPAAALDLTGTRLLHGAITYAVAGPHTLRCARWSLEPSAHGWVVVFYDRETAERMRAQSFDSRLGAEPRRLIFGGSLVHAKAPRPLPAGRYRVVIESVTPVSWASDGHAKVTTEPTPQTIIASTERIALAVGVDAPEAHRVVASVASETKRVKVYAGGHWQRGSRVAGLIRAIEGRIVVECNAVTAWLLACAEVVGIGGACSIGLGRVRVRVEAL